MASKRRLYDALEIRHRTYGIYGHARLEDKESDISRGWKSPHIYGTTTQGKKRERSDLPTLRELVPPIGLEPTDSSSPKRTVLMERRSTRKERWFQRLS